VILTLSGFSGSTVSLDLRKQFGESVELESFCFVTPPPEFRLLRQTTPLQKWQAANSYMYDLQHSPSAKEWCRDGRRFINDLDHRHDLMTCGILSKDLVMETRGLGFGFVLLVWPRESTCRAPRDTLHEFTNGTLVRG
jgi:hypothetical protein